MDNPQSPVQMANCNGQTNFGFNQGDEDISTSMPNGNVQIAIEGTIPQRLESRSSKDMRLSMRFPRTAVHVDGAHKSFGKLDVLNGLHMAVQEGTIYGLLGSSGCGKTTILSCIVALRKLDAGRILVYGKEPGTKGAGVPGSLVGYMPQEVALNEEFTMAEVCQYFGRLYGMDIEKVRERMKYLVDLLDLRKCFGRLANFSGGQKRRASFVVALLHEPEILILDEPTVGVDPILRSKIWTHIRNLADSFGTTIIITTHYIEEMRQAERVGIMRNGQLMAEASPQNLMAYHNATMLEDVVLKYCLKNKKESISTESSTPRRNSISFEHQLSRNGSIDSTHNINDIESVDGNFYVSNHGIDNGMGVTRSSHVNRKEKTTSLINRTFALTCKNVVVLKRNIGFILFLFIVPALIVVCFGLAVGRTPTNLGLGIVTDQSGSNCSQQIAITKCQVIDFSCAFMNMLGTSDIFQMKNYETKEHALAAVQDNTIWGYVHFGKNFSQNVFDRTLGHNFTDEIIEGSKINVRLDMSSISTGMVIKQIIYDTYRAFSQQLLTVCNIDITGRDLPVQGIGAVDWLTATALTALINWRHPISYTRFGEAIYGSENSKYTTFVIPGIVVGFLPFLSCVACAISYIIEKKDGMLDRTRVAGVTAFDVIVSHAIPQFGIVTVQSLIVFGFMYLFDVPMNIGSPILAFLLLLSSAAAGMAMGFCAAEIFDEEKNAMLFAMACLFPSFILSGLLWPVESLPSYLQIVSNFLPGTMPGEGIRSILFRGWGFSHFAVYMGFLSQFAFITFFAMIAFIVHKIRK